MFRPASIVHRITPVRRMPRIRLVLAGETGRGAKLMPTHRGVSHIRLFDDEAGFRVTTDAPITYVVQGAEIIIDGELSFILGPDEPLSDMPEKLAVDWQARTEPHWREWSRRLATPPEWQDAVVRAAISLRLCVYEETAGLVATLTTSIPEHAGSIRNWDYCFCWLRDAYFTVTALNRLSAMGALESYMMVLRIGEALGLPEKISTGR